MYDSDYENYKRETTEEAARFSVRDSGAKAEYADGMHRDTAEGKPKFSLLVPKGMPFEETLLYRAAMHYMLGGLKYGDRNWEKSSTPESLEHHTEALWRHFMKFASGTEDGEDHAAAIFWNLNAVLYTRWRLEQELARADAAAASDDDIEGVHEADVMPDHSGHGSYKIPDGSKSLQVNIKPHFCGPECESGVKQTYVFPEADTHRYHGFREVKIEAESYAAARTLFEQTHPKAPCSRCGHTGPGTVCDDWKCPGKDAAVDIKPEPDEPAVIHASKVELACDITTQTANPTDDEVALARSILAARQAFHDKEAAETLRNAGLDHQANGLDSWDDQP